MSKEKITYAEQYKKPGIKIKESRLPVCGHLLAGYECTEAYILEAGAVDRDGKRIEYQIIKVYTK